MEFEGEIVKISTDGNCATLAVKVTENPFEEISCGNCPADIDGWSDEVERVSVGQTVKIKGFYSSGISSDNTVYFYKCHILQ